MSLTGWYAFLKDFSYLFGAKSTGGKFNRWRHDNWPIGEWELEHDVTREAVGEAIFVIDLFESMEGVEDVLSFGLWK